VRPFITAYKNRSSKSPRPWDVDDPEKAVPKPLPVDLGANASAPSGRDVSYSAAMAAADAVFGGKAVEVVALQELPNVPTRRILPCLLQPEAELASPPEAATKARRAPRAVKPLGRKAVKATAPTSSIEPVAKTAVESSPILTTPDIPNLLATRRERSAIQSRWVRKNELKPGEKWKRRLCKAAH
jgi:hypothetical protein